MTPSTLDSTPTTTAQARAVRKLRPRIWAVALGRIMSALMSRRPTTRIDTTTVTAVRMARVRLRAVTGIPVARAYSSSLATAKRRVRRVSVTARTTTARPAKITRSELLVVRIAPKRYAVRLAGLDALDWEMRTTPRAMPP